MDPNQTNSNTPSVQPERPSSALCMVRMVSGIANGSISANFQRGGDLLGAILDSVKGNQLTDVGAHSDRSLMLASPTVASPGPEILMALIDRLNDPDELGCLSQEGLSPEATQQLADLFSNYLTNSDNRIGDRLKILDQIFPWMLHNDLLRAHPDRQFNSTARDLGVTLLDTCLKILDDPNTEDVMFAGLVMRLSLSGFPALRYSRAATRQTRQDLGRFGAPLGFILEVYESFGRYTRELSLPEQKFLSAILLKSRAEQTPNWLRLRILKAIRPLHAEVEVATAPLALNVPLQLIADRSSSDLVRAEARHLLLSNNRSPERDLAEKAWQIVFDPKLNDAIRSGALNLATRNSTLRTEIFGDLCTLVTNRAIPYGVRVEGLSVIRYALRDQELPATVLPPIIENIVGDPTEASYLRRECVRMIVPHWDLSSSETLLEIFGSVLLDPTEPLLLKEQIIGVLIEFCLAKLAEIPQKLKSFINDTVGNASMLIPDQYSAEACRDLFSDLILHSAGWCRDKADADSLQRGLEQVFWTDTKDGLLRGRREWLQKELDRTDYNRGQADTSSFDTFKVLANAPGQRQTFFLRLGAEIRCFKSLLLSVDFNELELQYLCQSYQSTVAARRLENSHGDFYSPISIADLERLFIKVKEFSWGASFIRELIEQPPFPDASEALFCQTALSHLYRTGPENKGTIRMLLDRSRTQLAVEPEVGPGQRWWNELASQCREFLRDYPRS